MRVGVCFYGLATVAFGILDLVWGKFEASHQPIQALGNHIPGEQVLAYIAAVWMVAAGIAILRRRTALMGAAGSALIYLIFALFWVLRFYPATRAFGFRIKVLIGVSFMVAELLLLVAPAAIVYASTASPDSVWRKRAAIAARWMLGLPPIAFGLDHLVNGQVFARIVPHWMPFGAFWVALTGIAFLLAGTAIISGIRDVLAARLLVLMLLVLEIIVEIPPVFIQPHNQGAWGGAVYNVAAIGACWIFASFVASRKQTNRIKTGLAEHYATANPGEALATSS